MAADLINLGLLLDRDFSLLAQSIKETVIFSHATNHSMSRIIRHRHVHILSSYLQYLQGIISQERLYDIGTEHGPARNSLAPNPPLPTIQKEIDALPYPGSTILLLDPLYKTHITSLPPHAYILAC